MNKKLLIVSDMEGIAGIGIDGFWPTVKGFPSYFFKRKLLVKQLNAAIRGAIQGGVKAEEIVVADWHATHHNVYDGELISDVVIIRNHENRMLEQGIEKVFLMGFHAAAGIDAGYAHTFTYPINQFIVDKKAIGETSMWAYNAGSLNIPIALVVGDCFAMAEAKALGLSALCVETKNIEGSYPVNKVCELIERAAAEAVKKELVPLEVASPFRVEFSFKSKRLMRLGKTVFQCTSDGLLCIESKTAHQAYDDFRGSVYPFIGRHNLLRRILSAYKGRN